ncbi:MAG: ATP-binding protein [Alphaproteobacteria bacterium]
MNDRPGAPLGTMLCTWAPAGKDAEETLHAIVLGDVDAIVVETKDGPRVYTLRDANEPYRHLVERMSESALVLDGDGTILYCNGRLAAMLGRDSLAGAGFLGLVADEQRIHAERLLASGAEFQTSAEFSLAAVDGNMVAARVTAAPMVFDGQPCVAMVVTALDDIAALKAALDETSRHKAEADRANLAKSKFLAAASHDLRQPVQSLVLLAEVIERQVADQPKTAKVVNMMKSAVDGLNGLLTGILDISRLDAGVVVPVMENVDLGKMVRRLADEYGPAAAAKGLTLCEVPRALSVRTDPAMLERIVRNLIENALRYTQRGGIVIGVRQRDALARLDIIDSGIGIPADRQADIFDEFVQVGNPSRERSQGLGLGLAIVARLTRLLGSEVHVASNVGRGSRFSLLLPIHRDDSPDPDAAVGPVSDDPGGRIFIIEDDAILRHGLAIMLGDWGYEVLSAGSGEDALDLAPREEWRFDAIIADHRLGRGLTGTATAKEIARCAGRPIPTLVVTGDTAKERIADVYASGFAMMHKPVAAEALRSKVAQLLRGGGMNSLQASKLR